MHARMWLVLVLLTAAKAERCDPPSQIVDWVKTLPGDNRERRKAIEARLKAGSADFWLRRLFLDGSVYQRSPVRDEYRKRFEAHPNDLDEEYLYGRSLV